MDMGRHSDAAGYDVPRVSMNSSTPKQNGRHFADDNFRCILVDEKFCILMKSHLNACLVHIAFAHREMYVAQSYSLDTVAEIAYGSVGHEVFTRTTRSDCYSLLTHVRNRGNGL